MKMQDLFDFINKGVSSFHAVAESKKRLEEAGFSYLSEMETWKLCPGKEYYVTRNESSMIAFKLPENAPFFYHITASHSDSPTFRIKKCNMSGPKYARAEVEGYGGMIYSGWLDRPLGLAGRVVIRTAEGVRTQLIAPDKDLFVIPNLAIHMNRDMNKGYVYNPQVDLQPLYGGVGADLAEYLLKEIICCEEEELVDMDLVLTVRQTPLTVGVKEEYYMAPRIDDLSCAFTTLRGFLDASHENQGLNMWCMFDNEEVGSGTRQGAMGSFLPDVAARLEEFYRMSSEERVAVRNRSLLVSADNAHATHPNLPAKTDDEFVVLLNGGIVVKYNASQRYTTTGMTAAVWESLCRENQIPIQRFTNRADCPGGSTLGNLLSHQFSIPMIDIGLPQLAMHSAVETAGCEDAASMELAVKNFYNSNLYQVSDGQWRM